MTTESDDEALAECRRWLVRQGEIRRLAYDLAKGREDRRSAAAKSRIDYLIQESDAQLALLPALRAVSLESIAAKIEVAIAADGPTRGPGYLMLASAISDLAVMRARAQQ